MYIYIYKKKHLAKKNNGCDECDDDVDGTMIILVHWDTELETYLWLIPRRDPFN
jgi:hypothetical protein